MKNITSFALNRPDLMLVDQDIYTDNNTFYLGLSFEQEAELGEGTISSDISQYPLEDILDEYSVFVSDFCDETNSNGTPECKLVFASDSLENLQSLRSIIGKHVYNAMLEKDGDEYVKLIIE